DDRRKSLRRQGLGWRPDQMRRTLLEQEVLRVSAATFAAVGGDVDRYKALSGGIVAATFVSSEYLPVSPPGIKILVAGRDVIPNFMRLFLNITRQTHASRGDGAAEFLAAELEGVAYF